MLTSPCYILADTHIGATPPDVDRALVAFLEARLAEARGGTRLSLVIDGDLFEFWFEWRTVIPRVAFRILATLAALHDAGVPILWIAGNHDGWGGEIIREDVGATYHVGAWEGDVAGWRARIEHGDGLRDREDRRYRAMRAVLQHPMAIRAFRWLPADLATHIAFRASHTSRTTRAKDGGAGLRHIALGYLAAPEGPELVVLGHSHVRTLERTPGGGVYANPGTWLIEPTFLRVTPDRIEMRLWTGGDGELLESLSRCDEQSSSRTVEQLSGESNSRKVT